MATNQTEQARTLPQMMAELQDLMGAPVQQFKSDMQAAQAITPIDPNILREAVQSGGALSTAQDFATSDAWAMTPEMFKVQMANRPDVGKQIGEVTTLSDAIFGRTNQRKSMEAIAQAQLGLSKDALDIASKGFSAQQNRIQDRELSNLDRASREGMAKESLLSHEKMNRENNDTRKYLARISMSGNQNDPYLALIKAGVPTHGDNDIKNYNNILTSKNATKQDKWQATQGLLMTGYYKPDKDGLITLKQPGFLGKELTYAIRKDPNTGLDWVSQRIGNTGDVKKDWQIVGPLSVKLPSASGRGGSGGSISYPAGLREEM